MNNKIYIIGGLGSGKSFLADRLSEKTRIEHFDLDRVVFVGSEFEEKNIQDRDVRLQEIIRKDLWIIEGTYTEDWIKPGLHEASKIIYLSTPAHIRLSRFIKRILKQGIWGQKGLIGRTTLVLGIKYKSWDRTANRYNQLLKPFEGKVTELCSEKQVKEFLDQY